MPHMTKSFYSFVMDNKDIVKMQNLLANCTKSVKSELNTFIRRWKAYHFLWKNDKTSRELMEMDLLEFEATLSCLAQLDGNLSHEPEFVYLINCIAVSTEKLKYGLDIEIKCRPLDDFSALETDRIMKRKNNDFSIRLHTQSGPGHEKEIQTRNGLRVRGNQ